MPADHPPPDWLDRRTAQWCVDVCAALHWRLWRAGLHDRGIGAQACANTIRMMLDAAGKRPLPPERSLVAVADTGEGDG